MDAGGYRQVRVLSESADEQVALCRRADDESAAPVVLRIVGEGRADAAIAVSSAVDSPHLAPILDLCAVHGDRFGLVYPRYPQGSLADLLARRPRLAPGEAATILVSVARGIAELHAAGFAHGALRASGVLFDAAGTPVLTAFGSATALTPVTARGDGRALSSLAAQVLERVPESDGIARILAHPPEGIAPNEMQEQLFGFAEPCPVDFPPAAAPTIEQLLPSRTAPPETTPPAPPAGHSPPGVVRRVLTGAGRLRAVRRRVWIPAVTAAVGLGAALLLVPQGASEGAALLPVSPPTGSSPSPSASASAAGAGAGEAAPFDAPDPAAVQGDDPVAAARALAAGRDSCLAAGTVDCIDAVDQSGSALLSADRAAGDTGTPTLAAPDTEPVVQRIGDAALVTFGADALLLVRGEGQWRLRDVFAAGAR